MSQIIQLDWPDLEVSVRASLLTTFNYELCQKFIQLLPFESIQSHAVVAGKQMYCPFRMPLDTTYEEEMMNEQPTGRMNIEFNFQYLSINYGPMTEPVPAVPVAQIVPEDINTLKNIGKNVWNNLLYEDRFLHVHISFIGGGTL